MPLLVARPPLLQPGQPRSGRLSAGHLPVVLCPADGAGGAAAGCGFWGGVPAVPHAHRALPAAPATPRTMRAPHASWAGGPSVIWWQPHDPIFAARVSHTLGLI